MCVNNHNSAAKRGEQRKKKRKEGDPAERVGDCVLETRSEWPPSPKSQVYQATSGNLPLVPCALMVTWGIITITQLCDHEKESQQL